ncbi:MAG TPA: alpha/beta fold hydrolase [bacterium]|nr:alpha/beta fold hydrolase [bacterium]
MLIPMNGRSAAFFLAGGETGCLLIHGFTGTPWVFRELGEWLNNNGLTVSAPLLPGHGTHPRDLIGVSWREWLDCCESEVERLEKRCRRILIIGHSMGGSIALILASRRPYAGVVSLSAPLQFHDIRMRLIPLCRPFFTYWKKKSSRSGNGPEMAYDCYPLPAVSQFMELMGETRRSLGRVVCPVLIMHSVLDRRVKAFNADKIYKGLGTLEKRLVKLPFSSHTILKGEDGNRVREEVLAFIRARSADSDFPVQKAASNREQTLS